ncbi:hypothetical protein RHSIM_Rhsim03G0100700 [Rhododendron simsii]|uniref:Uncharacterized protein n=1 Tax=Rhododendron simsii TaxID=118357 RepID=A0A834LSS4_RHOSS|nr:hypothetical protein RHSIM_Rhsim03G0100700 [Rhododendron simsii]
MARERGCWCIMYMVYRALGYGLSPMVHVHVRWRRVRGLESLSVGPSASAVLLSLAPPAAARSSGSTPILSDEHEDTKVGILGTLMGRNDTLCPEPLDSTHKVNGNGFASAKAPESVTPFGERKSCRFMYDKIEDKFNFLENRIRKHATALVALRLCEEVKDPTVASQVVGVEGHNPSGHCLIASKVIDYVPMSVLSDELPFRLQREENPLSLSLSTQRLQLGENVEGAGVYGVQSFELRSIADGAPSREGIAAILVIKCCIERRPVIVFWGSGGRRQLKRLRRLRILLGDMWQHCTMYGGLIDARFKSQDHGMKSAPPHSTIEKTFGGNHISTTTTQFRIWLCTMR